MLAFLPENPKRDQNLQFTPLSETTSIPVTFIWETPPPPGMYTVSLSWLTEVTWLTSLLEVLSCRELLGVLELLGLLDLLRVLEVLGCLELLGLLPVAVTAGRNIRLAVNFIPSWL